MVANAGEGGGWNHQALRFAQHFVMGRWFSLFASLIILCGGQGALYLFGLWSKELKVSLGYDQSTVSTLAFSQDLGCNIGILPGLLGELAPAWSLLMVSSTMNFSGFFVIWLAVTRKIGQPRLWQMCALMFTGANSLMFAATAVFVTVIRNFPENRGIVIGLLKGFMGLSGAIMTQIYLAIYGNEPKSLILLMAWLPVALYLTLAFSIRNHEPAKHPNERRAFYHFLYASVVLAISLLALTFLQKLLRFTRAAYTGSAVILYVILLAHLLLAMKEELSVWMKSKQPLSPTEANSPSPFEMETKPTPTPVLAPTNLDHKPKTSWWGNIVNKPARGEDYSVLQALLSIDMLCLFFATMFGIGSNLTAINNLGQIGQSLGYQSSTVETFVSLVSIWSYVGRIFAGFYSEHLLIKYKFPRTLGTTFFLLLSCLGYLLIAFPTPGSVYTASVLIGLSFGAQFALLYIIISELFGIKHYAMLSNCGQLACPLGSYILNVKIAGYIYDTEALKGLAAKGIQRSADMPLTCLGSHCYKLTFIILAVAAFLGALASLALAIRTREFYASDVYKKFRNDVQPAKGTTPSN